MTRDQLRSKFINRDTFYRLTDNTSFLVTKIEPLPTTYLFVVHFCKIKPDGSLGRVRILDLISFARKYH